MTICDVCNAEADGVIVPVREFQRHVAAGRFDPVRLGLTKGHSAKSDGENFDFWSAVVRENETDWFLCRRCHRVYLESTVASTAPAYSSGGELSDSLEDLRRLHPLPAQPAVPANWRPGIMAGLFGRGKPWGDTHEAAALIRHGRIAEARELLLRITAHSKELPARLLLCLEARRPPEFDGFKPGTLVPALPPAERAGVDALFAFTQIDYDWLGKAMLDATQRPPASDFGAFFLLMAVVAAGDLWLQTQILHPRKRAIESAIAVKSSKGLALFLERRNDEAWKIFREGIAAPESSIDAYRKTLGVDLSSAEAAKLAGALRGYCEIGCGLMLFDLGYETERRAIFRRLAKSFTGTAASACELLA